MLHDAAICLAVLCLCAGGVAAATPEKLAAEQELLRGLEIQPADLGAGHP